MIAIGASLINFVISLFIWILFDCSSTHFQFVKEYALTDSLNLHHFNFGVDGLSIFFILLTTFITPIALLSNYGNMEINLPHSSLPSTGLRPAKGEVQSSATVINKVLKERLNKYLPSMFFENGLTQQSESAFPFGENLDKLNSEYKPGLKLFLISILLLESLQICAFASLDLLMFYIFFESILPIVFILIIVFGHGDDRLRSAKLFFLFTLAGSLPMLLSILMIYAFLGSTDFNLIGLNEISLESQKLLFWGFFIAFAVKTPLMPFSIWLPKAHSDSPLAGSIILAGTMLKLASYGYLRVLIGILPDATNYFTPLILSISLITLVLASFSTIVQNDSKKLVAYSSIAHMSCCILGLFSNNIQGIEGAILLSIAHGLVSPALFICVGGVIYDRTHTRNIHYIRGLATYMPVFTIIFLAFILANTGIPLSLNFIGEQLALMGAFIRNPLAGIIGASGIVLSAIYSLYMYNRMCYGSLSPNLKPYKDLDRREYYILLSLLVPTFLLGIFPNVLLDSLHLAVTSLIYVQP